MCNSLDPLHWFHMNAFMQATIQNLKCLLLRKVMINWICSYWKRWKSRRIHWPSQRRPGNDVNQKFKRVEQQVLNENQWNRQNHKYLIRSRVQNATSSFKHDKKCSVTNGFTERKRSRVKFVQLVFTNNPNWIAIAWASMPNKRNTCAQNVAKVSLVDKDFGSTIALTMKAKQCHTHAGNAIKHSPVGLVCSYIWEFIRATNRSPARKFFGYYKYFL